MMNTESILLDSDQGAIMASLDPGLEAMTSHNAMPNNSENHKGNNVPQQLQKSLPDVLSSELQSLNLLADHEVSNFLVHKKHNDDFFFIRNVFFKFVE